MWLCLTGIYTGLLELGDATMFPESYELHVITSLLTFYGTYPSYTDKYLATVHCVLRALHTFLLFT